jgi:branched-subunit amino acid transport protein AzlD
MPHVAYTAIVRVAVIIVGTYFVRITRWVDFGADKVNAIMTFVGTTHPLTIRVFLARVSTGSIVAACWCRCWWWNILGTIPLVTIMTGVWSSHKAIAVRVFTTTVVTRTLIRMKVSQIAYQLLLNLISSLVRTRKGCCSCRMI